MNHFLMRIIVVRVVAVIVGCQIHVHSLVAQIEWDNPLGGSFEVGANWAGGFSPGASDSARFNVGGFYQVGWDAMTGNTVNDSLFVHDGTVVFYSVAGETGSPYTHELGGFGEVDGATLILGNSPSQTFNLAVSDYLDIKRAGTVTVRDGSRLIQAGSGLEILVGNGSQGNLNIESGGYVNSLRGILGGGSSSGNGTAHVTGSGSEWNVADRMVVGSIGTGRLDVDNMGLVDSTFSVIGGQSGSTGIVAINGTGSLLQTDALDVGAAGNGQLEILNGGRVDSFVGIVADESTSTSSVFVSGAGSEWDVTSLVVANRGSARVDVVEGGFVRNTFARIGIESGSMGHVEIVGSGSEFRNASLLQVGVSGNGSIFALGEGKLQSRNAVLGKELGSEGRIVLEGGSSWTVNGDVSVGPQGNGSLELYNNSAASISGEMIIGGAAGNSRVLIHSDSNVGTNSTAVENSGRLELVNGTLITKDLYLNGGRLDFQSGLIQVTNSNSLVDVQTSALGGEVLRLDDATLQVAGKTIFGPGVDVEILNSDNFSSARVRNQGTINVVNNATLGNVADIEGFDGRDGTLHVNSAIVNLNSLGQSSLGALTSLNGGQLHAENGMSIQAGGVLTGSGLVHGEVFADENSVIDASGSDLIIGHEFRPDGFIGAGNIIVGNGRLTLNDSNRVILDGTTTLGNDFGDGELIMLKGGRIFEDGELTGHGVVRTRDLEITSLVNDGIILGESREKFIEIAGNLTGTGYFGNVLYRGVFTPGASPALVFGENFMFSDESTLVMELGGLDRGNEYDALVDSGITELDGLLQVDLIDGFIPTDGDAFDLLDWNSRLGTFDQLYLPKLAGNLRWDTSQLYSSGVLSVSAIPEPASCLVVIGLLIGVIGSRRKVRSRLPFTQQ